MLLYAITNRRLLPGDESAQRSRLVELAKGWAQGGVHYIQVREKDLPLAELQPLAARIVAAVRESAGATRVLVNGPAQLAIDVAADGVHLLGGLGAAAVRAAQQVYARSGQEAVVSAACHSAEEIRQATGASLLLFSPVFEKIAGEKAIIGQGLAGLRAAAEMAKPVPVLALGGVTEKNAAACAQAGAAGVAAIRLFIGEGWRKLIEADPPSMRPST